MTLALEDVINATCPWSGQPVAADALTIYRGALVGFCNPGCRDKFEAAISMFDNCRAAGPGHSATPGQGQDVPIADKA
ncbi:glutathione S-transferase [Maricaulis sp. W15]|uniref:glutathione S-transferase n=1 Tax=Maricaulis sp. W15 TaxID=1772333 RepID=UPI000949124A|nr:glutathione S-transferase [Maricaulis sp. W15]